MKLNLDIIQEYLPENYHTRRYGPPISSFGCPRPLLYESGQPFQENTLYIAPADVLPQTLPPKSCAFIAVGTHLPQSWLLGGADLLVINGSHNIITVFNAVHALYNSFDQWNEQIRDELEKDLDFDIRRILRLGSGMLKRNITVTDHTLQNIFRAQFRKASAERAEVIISDTPLPLDMENGERIKEVCNLERIITVPYLSSIKGYSWRYYCFNLYIMGSFMGCIAIGEESTPFRQGDYSLMDHYFRHFQNAFLKYLRSCAQEDSAGLGTLKKLLEHRPAAPEELKLFSLQPGEVWCCFRLREQRSEVSLPKEYAYAAINAMAPGTIYAVIHSGEIMGLLRLPGENRQKTLELFEQALRHAGYYGGLSNTFSDLGRLHDYLYQASYALEQGKDPKCLLHFFSSYVLSYMLSSCAGDLPAESLMSEGLKALREHDRLKGSEYLRTLDLYLQNEMSVTRTSQALFIHRSSLLKRLDKIQRLLNQDLSDPDTRLYFRICLALLRESRPPAGTAS